MNQNQSTSSAQLTQIFRAMKEKVKRVTLGLLGVLALLLIVLVLNRPLNTVGLTTTMHTELQPSFSTSTTAAKEPTARYTHLSPDSINPLNKRHGDSPEVQALMIAALILFTFLAFLVAQLVILNRLIKLHGDESC